ncbi:type III-B CRISPR module RAMP protein Cmr6 [Acidianus sp. HS-5]|uniref:type III-B CRISPR module RAMP protein Cmr6 n=1 Tax=Acidianus sp. HS-5 TaxID=2886040 RepID=UPI001F00E44A|nr:type III-B CRISPR module RAMP protein Cmr6 [Acidianus sp. HS-5]BDC17370.1 type III-B CRISPR module RAMP protein Cmr6 [Acidianus sp. HS-5]
MQINQYLIKILEFLDNEENKVSLNKNINLFSFLSTTSIIFNMLNVFMSENSYNSFLEKYSIIDCDIKHKKALMKRKIAESISKYLDKELLKQANAYTDNLKSMLKKLHYTIIDVKIITRTKMLVGVSTSLGKLVFESGISFDPYMNLPYIPASEIKGIIRSYIEDKLGEQEAKEIFGDTEREGSINFTDAYPVRAENFVFVPDVITPHYSKKKSEADAEPTPIIHLTIAPKVTFRFLIYYKREDVGKPVCDTLPIVVIKGLGARSSVGYSLFELTGLEVVR